MFRILIAVATLSFSAYADHTVSDIQSLTANGVKKREIITSENRCANLWLSTKEGLIPYLLDTETKKIFFVPEIELKDFRLTGVQGDAENDSELLDEHGELTFHPTMTAKSEKELALLKKAHGKVENLFGKEEFKIGADVISDGKPVSSDPEGSVNLRVSRNGYDILKQMGKSKNPLLPSFQYPNPCGEKAAVQGRMAAPEKLALGFRGIHRTVSVYSSEITKKLDEYRQIKYGAKDAEVKRKASYEAFKLLLQNPLPRDKAIIKRLGLDPMKLAQDLSNASLLEGVWNDPAGALIQSTFDLAHPIWQVKVQNTEVPYFFHDDKNDIHEVRHFLVNDPAEKAKMAAMDSFNEDRIVYGKKLVAQGKAIELTQKEWSQLMRENSPSIGSIQSRGTRIWDWDEDDNGNRSALREKLEYQPYKR